jgi:hypothetical protein
MNSELNPKLAGALVGVVVVILGVAAYFMFKPAPTFDLAKVQIHTPRGYDKSAQPGNLGAAVKSGAPNSLKFAPRGPGG